MITHRRDQEILEIKTTDLSLPQIRLLKSLFCTLRHAMTTFDESQFFNGSAESLKICAALIQHAEFIQRLRELNDIAYAEQVLEYSIDMLQESIEPSKIVRYDN